MRAICRACHAPFPRILSDDDASQHNWQHSDSTQLALTRKPETSLFANARTATALRLLHNRATIRNRHPALHKSIGGHYSPGSRTVLNSWSSRMQTDEANLESNLCIIAGSSRGCLFWGRMSEYA